jgi:hypothetical protein
MPRPFPSTFLPIHHSPVILSFNLVTDSVSYTRCCWPTFVRRTRHQMTYVRISITVTQGERKRRIALNMHEFSEAQIFVYRQNFNPRNNYEVNLVSKHCTTSKAAWGRVRRAHVFSVLSRQVHWHCDINVSARKQNNICSTNMYSLFWRPYHVGVFTHHWKQVTFAL